MEITASRRRSQRIFLQVRVAVEWTAPDKSPSVDETHTIVVNAHGALVEMNVPLEQGQIVSLRNMASNEKIDCAVKLVTPTGAGKFNMALEFTHPNPAFWHISFPPEDWTIRTPEAKRNR
jgi:hypothetical protein